MKEDSIRLSLVRLNSSGRLLATLVSTRQNKLLNKGWFDLHVCFRRRDQEKLAKQQVKKWQVLSKYKYFEIKPTKRWPLVKSFSNEMTRCSQPAALVTLKVKRPVHFALGRRRRLKNKIEGVMKIHDMDEEYKNEANLNIENQNDDNSVPRNFIHGNSIMFSNSKDRSK